ncbi:MAG: GyrI-like domain-containing protein [Anaerolineae bacterium]|nr:GyrI-like domain-containing protein [Anaerolineae bacterium]
MPIISKIQMYEQPEQAVLSIRKIIQFNDFPEEAKLAFKKINDYVGKKNILFAGCPFVCYHNSDLNHLDVEIGFPVNREIPGEDCLKSGKLFNEKVVSGIFLGPYEESDPLMMEIFTWINNNGFEAKGRIYHHYLNDEDQPRDFLLTQICIPIK